MTTKPDGGPAFPMTVPLPEGASIVCHGMTLRDWFAGQALAGLCANTELTGFEETRMASWAWKQADAMLSARGRPQ